MPSLGSSKINGGSALFLVSRSPDTSKINEYVYINIYHNIYI